MSIKDIRDLEYGKFDSEGNVKVNQRATNPNGNIVEVTTSGTKVEFSTDTPLGVGETFDSGVVYLNGFGFLSAELTADSDGFVEGIWYGDEAGTQILRTFTSPYISSNGLAFLSVPVLAEYFKLRFTNNSGVAQTFIRTRIKLTNESLSPQLLQVDQFLPTNAICSVTRSVLTGRNPEGIYTNVGTNEVGALNISSFLLDVAAGKYPSYASGTKFGRNSEIDTGTAPEDVWDGVGNYTGLPTTGTATTLSIFSSSALDTSAGTGARTVRISGLNASYEPISEIVTLNGTTPVITTNSYWRQSRAEVVTAGSTGFNQGAITSHWTGTPSQIFMNLPIGSNQTAIAADTVPAGKVRIILGMKVSMARSTGLAGSANVRFLTRELSGVFNAIRNTEITNSLAYNSELRAGILLPEKTDMKWQVYSVSDNKTIVTAEFEFIDIDM